MTESPAVVVEALAREALHLAPTAPLSQGHALDDLAVKFTVRAGGRTSRGGDDGGGAPTHRASGGQILSECERVYKRSVPNYALNALATVGDVVAFFGSPAKQDARPRDERVFASLNLAQLPPNLTIRR